MARAKALASQDGGGAGLNNRLLRQTSPATPSGDLPLGPGDLIEVSVFEVSELSNLKVRIPRPGVIALPLLGSIQVAGLTASDLENELRQRLGARYMHDPQVTVFVHERRSQQFSVIGAVRKGGVYELSGRVRLADALARAEGLSDDADHVVYLFRRMPAGSGAAAEGRVAATARPSVPPAGATPKAVDSSGGQTMPGMSGMPGTKDGESGSAQAMTMIDLEAVADGNQELNVPLEAGDVIQVPRAGSYYVGGSVEKPGSFLLKAKTTVQQAVVAAGGPTNVAALHDVRLYRTKPDSQVEVIALDLAEFEAGKLPPDVRRNDVVMVGKSGVKAFFYGAYEFLRGVFGVSKGL